MMVGLFEISAARSRASAGVIESLGESDTPRRLSLTVRNDLE
jgi:hypothetical protein